ncbi:hypothetical protein ACFQJ7_14540 [Halovenus rubra]|uniref:Uncharacterized protein n=2 Tax=Halovenus rubra TaxID=869890 RepID=A0ABD5X7N7_9EURY|nr:hypothetical protein [Halovenus rubra]
MTDDNGDTSEYDPQEPTPPEREPPYRQTAPQSTFTGSQVGIGLIVTLVGVAVTFGVPLLLG